MNIKHIQKTTSGKWQYRRRFPESIKATLGRNDFKRVLRARTEAEVLREYPRIEAEFDLIVKEASAAKAGSEGDVSKLSPREMWSLALDRAEKLVASVQGYDPIEDDRRDIVAASILSQYPEDPEDGSPQGLPRLDAMTVRALSAPSSPPAPNIDDALSRYLTDKHGGGEGSPDNKDAKVRMARMFKRVRVALGARATVALADLRREDARNVVAHMLQSDKLGGGKLSPASVRREVNQIKAVINHALLEFDLVREGVGNPFNKIPIAGAQKTNLIETDAEKRDPLPDGIIAAMRQRLKGDHLLIWRLLEGTGCRLAEITGLRLEDVTVDSDLPSIRVKWHEDRRLKNVVSIRSVPLVGDALEAAKGALELPRAGNMIFPRYGRPKGAGAASQILMKYLHMETSDTRHKIHSLRHNLTDRLMLAEVPELTVNLIRGHSLGGVGNRVYGGDRAKLTATTRAMCKAFGLVEDSA